MIGGEEEEKLDAEREGDKTRLFSFLSSSLPAVSASLFASQPPPHPTPPHPTPPTRASPLHANAERIRKHQRQDLDVAIIKATSSATHVAPKEKHVATLKAAVGPQAPRAQVSYVCRELRARLRSATDWLVRD